MSAELMRQIEAAIAEARRTMEEALRTIEAQRVEIARLEQRAAELERGLDRLRAMSPHPRSRGMA